jgi:hypothetical protein
MQPAPLKRNNDQVVLSGSLTIVAVTRTGVKNVVVQSRLAHPEVFLLAIAAKTRWGIRRLMLEWLGTAGRRAPPSH